MEYDVGEEDLGNLNEAIIKFEKDIDVLKKKIPCRPNILIWRNKKIIGIKDWILQKKTKKTKDIRFRMSHTAIPKTLRKEFEPVYYILVRMTFIVTEMLDVRMENNDWDSKCSNFTNVICRLLLIIIELESPKDKQSCIVYKECYLMYKITQIFFIHLFEPLEDDPQNMKDVLDFFYKRFVIYQYRATFLLTLNK